MTAYTESARNTDVLLSEAPGTLSRETVTIATGQVLAAGTVLGTVTVGGEYKGFLGSRSDGSEVASAVLLYATDTSNGAALAVVITRLAEIKLPKIVWIAGSTAPYIAAGTVSLADKNIIIR
jgi:hypothetical protein